MKKSTAADLGKSRAGRLFRLLLPALAGLGVGDGFAQALHPGETPYRRICFSCHDPGANLLASLGAPRLGDRRAWETRIGAGVDGLYSRIMVRRSGNFLMPTADLTTDEIKAAISFMLDEAR